MTDYNRAKSILFTVLRAITIVVGILFALVVVAVGLVWGYCNLRP